MLRCQRMEDLWFWNEGGFRGKDQLERVEWEKFESFEN